MVRRLIKAVDGNASYDHLGIEDLDALLKCAVGDRAPTLRPTRVVVALFRKAAGSGSCSQSSSALPY